MNTLKRALAGTAMALTLGAGTAVAPAVVAAPGSPVGPAVAEAVPYKMPVGTWGGLCGKRSADWHVRYEWHGVNRYERRHYVEWRNRWNGSRWECRTRHSYDYLLLVA